MPLYRLTYHHGTNDLVSAAYADGIDVATRAADQGVIGERIEYRVLPHFPPGTQVTGRLAVSPQVVIGTVVTGTPRPDGTYEVMGRYQDSPAETAPSRFFLEAPTVQPVA